ncbi:AlpA family phage regulatory protein [uncultured Paracoccus sp.]|uniref:helix-turn-helix transcriptional regulator n=1 Tax=uncultured Paracoccus sp. TaxID=189685 RepID=UPI00262269DA|nr:AlpA family phage regulatory protein [uncultured Paracoccus sp.]
MIRIDEVMRITSMSRPTIYRMMQSNGFPQQRRLSHKVAVWLESEVMRWIDEQLGLLV